MNIALQKQFLSLNQKLKEKGCPITAKAFLKSTYNLNF